MTEGSIGFGGLSGFGRIVPSWRKTGGPPPGIEFFCPVLNRLMQQPPPVLQLEFASRVFLAVECSAFER